MTANTQDRLYKLLPALYRSRDFEQGESLRALLALIQGEYDALEVDIGGLYENWFIETCQEWVDRRSSRAGIAEGWCSLA